VKVVIYGSRPDGQAKVIADLVAADPTLEVVGLLDDLEENAKRSVLGFRVIGTGGDLSALRAHDVQGILIGFGESRGRADVARRATAAGYALPRLVHPSARVCASAELGDGVQVLALAYVGPDACLGTSTLVNTGAIVEHDAILEDGAVVGPGVTVCGRVRVRSEASIGAGATVLPDVTVGLNAIVGAGALVREDVADATLVAGVPARPLVTTER
jgi:sugar O-acyltransferase (sialic acid O-acetyltransferase NeuD family)